MLLNNKKYLIFGDDNLVSVSEIIELDKHSHDKNESIKMPAMKLRDVLYIAINKLNPIGEKYSAEENKRAEIELTKLYNFLYGSEDFSVNT